MAKCKKCKNTGVIETGNNDMPCECEKGNYALFNICEVKGYLVRGWMVKQYFLNSSPDRRENVTIKVATEKKKGEETQVYETYVREKVWAPGDTYLVIGEDQVFSESGFREGQKVRVTKHIVALD